jgi:hypothetical protein
VSIGIIESDNGTKLGTIKKLQELDENMNEELRRRLEEVWDKILMDAISECPMESGALASTIRIVEGAFGGMMGGIVGRMVFEKSITAGDETVMNPKGTPTSHYASSVHDGYTHWKSGRWIAGYPFLDIAIDKNFDELERAIEEAMKTLGKKFGED